MIKLNIFVLIEAWGCLVCGKVYGGLLEATTCHGMATARDVIIVPYKALATRFCGASMN